MIPDRLKINDKDLSDKFRLIISHKTLGCNWNIDKSDWEEMLNDLTDTAYKHFGELE